MSEHLSIFIFVLGYRAKLQNERKKGKKTERINYCDKISDFQDCVLRSQVHKLSIVKDFNSKTKILRSSMYAEANTWEVETCTKIKGKNRQGNKEKLEKICYFASIMQKHYK